MAPAMSRLSLSKTVRSLWPHYEWTQAEFGIEKGYRGKAPPYEILVEWRGGSSYVTLARYFTSLDTPVSVVGVSDGMGAEAVRRAYLEAKLAWMSLIATPKEPTPTTAEDLEEDWSYFKKLLGTE